MTWLDTQKIIVTLMEHFHSEPVWAIDPDRWRYWNAYGDIEMVNDSTCGWTGTGMHAHWGIFPCNDPFYQKHVKFTGKPWRNTLMDGKALLIDLCGNVCTIVCGTPVNSGTEAMENYRDYGDPLGRLFYKWFNWKNIEAEAQKTGIDPMKEFLSQIDFHRTQLVNYLDVFVKCYEKFMKTIETTLSGMSYISNGF